MRHTSQFYTLEKQIDSHIITHDTPTPRLAVEHPIASDNGALHIVFRPRKHNSIIAAGRSDVHIRRGKGVTREARTEVVDGLCDSSAGLPRYLA